jgi:hypothetical protein
MVKPFSNRRKPPDSPPVLRSTHHQQPRLAYPFGPDVITKCKGAVRLLAPAKGSVDTTAVDAPEVRYAKSGDVSIAYAVVGDGPFDLIFVGGWIFSALPVQSGVRARSQRPCESLG